MSKWLKVSNIIKLWVEIQSKGFRVPRKKSFKNNRYKIRLKFSFSEDRKKWLNKAEEKGFWIQKMVISSNDGLDQKMRKLLTLGVILLIPIL